MRKRTIVIVISMLMMAVILSMGNEKEVKAAEESVATSGQCGENTYWSYDKDTETLTISGSGEVDFDYEDSNGNYLRWYDLHFTTVKIGKDVTGLGHNNFAEYERFEKYEVDSNNPYLCSKDGVLYDKNMKRLLDYPTWKKDKVFTVPSGVEEVGDIEGDRWGYSGGLDYDLMYLEHLIIPESVRKIRFGTYMPERTFKYMTIYSKKFEFYHSDWVFPYNIVYGYPGSDAEALAKSMRATFIPLDKKDAPKVKVSGISISGVSKKIAAGKEIQLTANVSPSNATLKAVYWSSSNKNVATVGYDGIVSLKKGSGGKSVTITAEATDGSGVKATYKITSMKGVVKKVTVTGKKSVKAGNSVKLKAKVKASKGANKKLKWTGSNTKYAKVTKSGKVKTYKAGKGKTVKITAAATDGSNKKKTFKLKIK